MAEETTSCNEPVILELEEKCPPPDEVARILLVGTGTMGRIRATCMSSNPKIELCGIIDVDFPAAEKLAAVHHVRN